MLDLTKKQVLIVDDSRAMRDILRVHLSNLGIAKVKMAERVADALREVRDRDFDVILCDYHLSDGRTGQQFLEELRARDLITYSKVFIMVTSEQMYENVVAVAEYAPDDYLIKPFVSTALEERLLQAFEKKHTLRSIFAAMDVKDYKKAFDACQMFLRDDEKKYRKYVERLRAECCLRAENYEHAAHYYEEILQDRKVAWAELGLGKALHHLGEYDRATELLKHVCDRHPMYLEGYDSLAKVHESAGEDNEAETVVDRAIERSPLRLDRHARLGEIALRNGNLDKAEKAFTKVVTDGVGSCYHAPDAYYRLAEIHTVKGDTKKANEVLGKLGEHFEGASDAVFCAAVAEFAVAKQNNDSDKMGKAYALAKKTLEENQEAPFPESVRIRFACAALEQGDEGLARQILKVIYQNNARPENVKAAAMAYVTEPNAVARLMLFFDEFGGEIDQLNEQSQDLARQQRWDEAVNLATEAVIRLKNNIEVLLSAAQINLMRMERKGWDEVRFPTVRKYLERARAMNPKHPKIAVIEMLIERIKKKYGIKVEKRDYYSPSAEAKKKVSAEQVGEKYAAGDEDGEINLDELL